VVTLPQHIRKLVGKNEHGPNCFNAAIMYHDPKEPVGYTDEIAMSGWIARNTWRVDHEEKMVGDLMIMWDGHQLMHVAIFLGVKDGAMQFFHKPGCGYGWKIDSLDEIRNIYDDYTTSVHWNRVGAVISRLT
jgi:hypothetical protein